MQRKLLITVSDETSHLHGVRFVGSFFGNKSTVSATLFYVAPHGEAAGGGSGAKHARSSQKATTEVSKKAGKALDTARQMLCDRGFAPDNVTTKFIFKQFGTVKDIIREAKAGSYDAIVLGRRGYMLFESIISTSVTKEILARDIDFPIWVCKHPEENRKNVLVCVDGSEASLRMVDHTGFMLKDEDEHSITLLHLDTGEGEGGEIVLREARKKLLDNWISDGRINSVMAASGITAVAETILEQTHQNAFAAVGVGRVGIQKGRFKEWLVGSRTLKLVETIEKAALWVSS